MNDNRDQYDIPDTERVISMVEEIVEAAGVKNYRVPDVGPGIMLHHLLDESGLIAPMMMKMDIDTTILMGKKLWGASYVVDRETLFGMTVEDGPEENDNPEIKGSAVAKLFAKYAFNSVLRMDHEQKTVHLKPLPIYYLYNLKNEEGAKIELPPMDIVYSVSLNETLIEYRDQYEKSLTQQNEPRP